MSRSLLLVLLLSMGFHFAFGQGRKINGVVIDEEGRPVAEVNVIPNDGIAPTITNAQGVFSIAITANTTHLNFSSVSYISQRVPIADSTTVNVVLKQDVIGLEEVVAVGYGTQRKANLTGAVTSVTVD